MKEIRINVEELAKTYGLQLPVSVKLGKISGKPVLVIEEVK
jgi:hypothetical protein